MSKDKKTKNILSIIFEALKIYCFNFHKFFVYMSFPILGQILGGILIFVPVYFYTEKLPDLINGNPAFNNFSTLLLFSVLITVPGMLIWAKALWDYLVAYGALNSMAEAAVNTGKVYDFKAHNAVVYQRTFSFVSLWLLYGIFTFLAVIPIFWVLGLIFFIYFILIFQLFVFEKNLSPVGCFRKSLELIKGNFAKTFVIVAILFVLTYELIPAGISVISDAVNLTPIINKIFEKWVLTFPLENLTFIVPDFEKLLMPDKIASNIYSSIIFAIAAGFTLPLRSICMTLWYKNLTVNSGEAVNQISKSTKKTVSKKVKSYDKSDKKQFKIEKHEINPEIIRRARLDDDEY